MIHALLLHIRKMFNKMNLTSLKNTFFPQEFEIDEQPLPILNLERRTASSSADEPADLPLPSGDIDAGPDLLSQTASLLVEQVRLTEMARLAESSKNKDDELGRFVRQALPFLDNFSHLLEMAREHPPSPEIDSWLKSIEALYYRILKTFESFGLKFINSIGKPVDLDYHEVVEYRPSNQYPNDTVIKELQKGVVFRGRLIRDARVVVAYNTGDAG